MKLLFVSAAIVLALIAPQLFQHLEARNYGQQCAKTFHRDSSAWRMCVYLQINGIDVKGHLE